MKRSEGSPPSRPRPRSKKREPEPLRVTATVRLDDVTLERIDAIVAARSTEWRTVTRAEVLRELIHVGITAVERRRRRTPLLKLLAIEDANRDDPG